MCLSRLKKFRLDKYVDDGEEVVLGYKVFSRYQGRLGGEYYNRSGNYKQEYWYIEDSTKGIESCNGAVYECGFHAFTNESGVKKWIGSIFFDTDELWLCEFKNVVAKGTQRSQNVFVAKEMRLVKRIK